MLFSVWQVKGRMHSREQEQPEAGGPLGALGPPAVLSSIATATGNQTAEA
jgi:hypothetical protein